MLIWLGKNLLKQIDKQPGEGPDIAIGIMNNKVESIESYIARTKGVGDGSGSNKQIEETAIVMEPSRTPKCRSDELLVSQSMGSESQADTP
jgi:hypothetical protein